MTETQDIPCGRNPGATQPSPAHDPGAGQGPVPTAQGASAWRGRSRGLGSAGVGSGARTAVGSSASCCGRARASPVGPSPRMPAAPCPSRTCSARAGPCDVFSSPCAVTRASRAFSQSRLVFLLYSDEWRLVA